MSLIFYRPPHSTASITALVFEELEAPTMMNTLVDAETDKIVGPASSGRTVTRHPRIRSSSTIPRTCLGWKEAGKKALAAAVRSEI